MSNDLIKFFENDRFAYGNGMRIIEVSPGYAVAEMEISQNHMNAVNTVQGGAIFTLADYAFAAACNSKGFVTVAINVSISFLKSPKGKVLMAKASEVSSSRKLCCYNVDVFDENNDIVARFTGNGFIKSEKLDI